MLLASYCSIIAVVTISKFLNLQQALLTSNVGIHDKLKNIEGGKLLS